MLISSQSEHSKIDKLPEIGMEAYREWGPDCTVCPLVMAFALESGKITESANSKYVVFLLRQRHTIDRIVPKATK
jgi:hypothetical protein